MRTSYEYTEPGIFCSQCAVSRPSAAGTTDGKSAQLTNQSSPAATVRAALQDEPCHVANLSSCPPATGCSQLMTTGATGPAREVRIEAARCAGTRQLDNAAERG